MSRRGFVQHPLVRLGMFVIGMTILASAVALVGLGQIAAK